MIGELFAKYQFGAIHTEYKYKVSSWFRRPVLQILICYSGSTYNRAAKLSLLNFLSLFRETDAIQWGGGSSRIFPWSPKADAIQWGGG